MASDLIVPVVELKNVRKHPNADKLDIADVLGYQMCVPKDKYKSGDVGVYFPADTILTYEWIRAFDISQFLKGPKKNRVSKIRLRGEPSFGLIVEPPMNILWKVGDNLAEFYECKKYEPPIKPSSGDAAKHNPKLDPYIDKYTDIQNGRIFTDVFKDGEKVIATEKIHGTNCKIGIINGIKFASSMEVRRKFPSKFGNKTIKDKLKNWWFNKTSTEEERLELCKTNTYWYPWTLFPVRALIDHLSVKHNSVIIYGEVYGGSIQSLNYGIHKGKGLGFRIFDIKLDGKFESWENIETLHMLMNVDLVPVIYQGPYSMENMKKVCEGKTLIGHSHIREGVVVRPVEERNHPKLGRVCLKYISTEYSLSNQSDCTDK